MKVFSFKKYIEGVERLNFTLTEMKAFKRPGTTFRELDGKEVIFFEEDLYISENQILLNKAFVVDIEDWQPYEVKESVKVRSEHLIMKYRKKPVVIEAIQFNGWNWQECYQFMSDERLAFNDEMSEHQVLKIETLEGIMTASINDFIIKGVNGEFYPCKPDIFEKTYEKVEQDELTNKD
jgi:hypothetical protein